MMMGSCQHISSSTSLQCGCIHTGTKLHSRKQCLHQRSILCTQTDLSNDSNRSNSQAIPRRQVLLATLAVSGAISSAYSAQALGFKKELKRKKIPVEEYTDGENGLKYYELKAGSGDEVQTGEKVTVHFDCMYKGINVVSSRSARLLGGNRSVAEPYEFVAGAKLGDNGPRKVSDSAGGLFSGAGGPKPPPALSTAVIGMRDGGKRTVIVPPELAYGDKGIQEIPAGATIEMQIEVLSIG